MGKSFMDLVDEMADFRIFSFVGGDSNYDYDFYFKENRDPAFYK